MSNYVTVRLTLAQAKAAANACDLHADSMLEAKLNREAALYKRTYEAIDLALCRVGEDD